MEKLNEYQNQIIKKLALSQGLRFSEILWDEVSSEHMNYYLKKLIELGYVEKNKLKYCLTSFGKDYCNRTDYSMKEVERQPKTGVILFVTRMGKIGVEYLVNKRLRQPYFGKVGRMTGKVKFGETLEEAAKRELLEETGLVAGSCQLLKVYHKLRKDKDGVNI